MKSYELKKSIIEKYAKSNQKALRADIDKLLEIYKSEIFEIHHVFTCPDNSSSYEKAMTLIRNLDLTEWHPITDIPSELFVDFFNIAEMHPEIVFDEKRDFQYFKIINFRHRNYSLA